MKVIAILFIGLFWFWVAQKMKISHFRRLKSEGKNPKDNLALEEVNGKEWLIFLAIILFTFLALAAVVNSNDIT